jgi:hypothetical protein
MNKFLVLILVLSYCSLNKIYAQPHGRDGERFSGDATNPLISNDGVNAYYIIDNTIVSSDTRDENKAKYIFGSEANLSPNNRWWIGKAYLSKDEKYIYCRYNDANNKYYASVINSSGKVIRTIPSTLYSNICITMDNKYLVQADNKTEIVYYDILSGAVNKKIRLADSIYSNVILSKDCKYLLAESWRNNSIVLYDINLNKKVNEFKIRNPLSVKISTFEMFPTNKAVIVRTYNDANQKGATYIFDLDGTLIDYYDYYCLVSNTGRYLAANGVTFDLLNKSVILNTHLSGFSSNDEIVYIERGNWDKNQLISSAFGINNTIPIKKFITYSAYPEVFNDLLKSSFFADKDQFETEEEYKQRVKKGELRLDFITDSLATAYYNKIRELNSKPQLIDTTFTPSFFQMQLGNFDANASLYEISFCIDKSDPIGIYLKISREDAKILYANFNSIKVSIKIALYSDHEEIRDLYLHSPLLSKDYHLRTYKSPL